MKIKLPYAKSELYAMAKSKKQHKKLVELVFDAKYADEDVCTTADEHCMELMNRRVEKSKDNESRGFSQGYNIGIFQIMVLHDKYPILLRFGTVRKSILSDISVPIRSPEGLIFKIHDLREILSWAQLDDMDAPVVRTRECIPGTHYYI